MTMNAFWWLFFNFISIAVLAFYSMIEMAAVSFNQVRLQYYVTKGIKPAIWLNDLLHHPSRLFGTTLIGVNLATVIGSECSREFYSAIGIDPDFAPLTQVILVVIVGELAPMFAARHFAEHVVMLGVPLLYASSRIMAPLLWLITLISDACHFLIGGKKSEHGIFLTKEELVKILEVQEDHQTDDAFQEIAFNIFKLRQHVVMDIMHPLSSYHFLDSNSTITQMRELIATTDSLFIPIYHRTHSNIVGIAYPRDMLRAGENRRARDYSKSPWFIMYNSSVMEVLQQFRRSKQNVMVVINEHGAAIGIITLDALMEEVISNDDDDEEDPSTPQVIIDRSVPGDMTIGEFNKQFGVTLDQRTEMTLGDLIATTLDCLPQEGDSIYIEPYQLTASEVTLTEVKEVTISTKVI